LKGSHAMKEQLKLELQKLITECLCSHGLIKTDQQVEISVRNNEDVDRKALESVLQNIYSTGCRKKITNFLQEKGVITLSAAARLTPNDFLKYRGLGKKSTTEFALALNRAAIQTAPEWFRTRWLHMRLRKLGYA
jgi:DNA-directed RNA polymerase alpha subunit